MAHRELIFIIIGMLSGLILIMMILAFITRGTMQKICIIAMVLYCVTLALIIERVTGTGI